MSMEKTLKEILDEILDEVEKELDEATATGNVAGYQTPYAFGNNRKKDKKKEKETATQAGYTLAESVNEAKIKKVNKSKWNRMKFDDRVTALLSVVKDPDDAEEYAESKWEDLPSGFERDMVIYESINEAMVKVEVDMYKQYNQRKPDRTMPMKIDSKTPLSKLLNHTTFKAIKQKYDYIELHYGNKFLGSAMAGTDNWKFKKGRGLQDTSFRESVNEAKVKRPVNRWLELKNDETMHPHKKMAMGLKELKYQLRETEKFFNWYNKIKTMNELDSENYWKRTNRHIYSIKEKLINIAKTIQEIER